MRLSVVIAAYNAAATLASELEALAAQDAPFAWEVVVSDNGSTDRTADVARAFVSRLPRLLVVDSSATRGPGGARNAGAAAASGDVLAFCDADDVVAPGWVAAMGEALRHDDIVTGTSRRRELNSRPGDGQFHEWSRYVMPFFPQLPVAGAGNMGVSAELFRLLDGFDPRLSTGEDLDLCWRAQLLGRRLGHAREARVDVSNREGLRATYRQFRSYGAGNRLLIEKYRDVIAAYAGLPAWDARAVAPVRDAADGPPRGAAPARFVSRVLRKARSIRRPSDLTHLVSRIGYAYGSRWGRSSVTVERLPVPEGGPLVP